MAPPTIATPSLRQTLPGAIARRAAEHGLPPEAVRLSVSADLSNDGRFVESWLVVSNDKLLVLSDSGMKAFDLRRLNKFKSTEYSGCGFLTAEEDGARVELIRYTHSRSHVFSLVAGTLDKLAKGEKVEIPAEELRKCPKCGGEYAGGNCPRCRGKRRIFFRLLRYARPHKLVFLLTMLLMLLSTAMNLAPPYLQKILFDEILIGKRRVGLLLPVVLALLGFAAAGLVISMYAGRLNGWLGSRLAYEIRAEVFRHLQQLSLSFYDRLQIGAVMERVSQDTGAVQEFLSFGLRIIVVQTLLLVLSGAMLFIMNWRLALWVLVPAPAVVFITIVSWRVLRSAFHRLWERWARMGGLLNNILSGLKEVKAFAQEPREIARFDRRSFELFEWSYRTQAALAFYFPLMGFVSGLGLYVIWYLGGRDVLSGKMTPGTLIAFISYLGMFYGPIQFLSQVGGWLSRSITSAERVFEILDAKTDVPEPAEPVEIGEIRGEIEFRDVTFGYVKHKPVLHGVSLCLRPGEMVGLVGHSGAGKSTVINLLLRFYDVDAGAVLIDGVDIRRIPLAQLRSQVGVVFQEPLLFSGTIAENLGYAKPGATAEEIIVSAHAANAHSFIMAKPCAYDAQVGERGSRLSVGEKQRIAIARAILHAPRILILDEATSAVDLKTEEQIQEAIGRLVRGRTTIAIAHRLSTLRNADRLFVLEHGRRVEEGTHEELFRKRGVYYNLVVLQRRVSSIQAVDG